MMTTAYVSRYGYPVCEFEVCTLAVNGRQVVLGSIIWDAEYAAFRGIGHYAKVDGTAGKQIAKPIMSGPEVPADVRRALNDIMATHSGPNN